MLHFLLAVQFVSLGGSTEEEIVSLYAVLNARCRQGDRNGPCLNAGTFQCLYEFFTTPTLAACDSQ